MSHKLISLSQDYKKLLTDGYEVEISENYILVHNVPYVDSNKKIQKGTLITNVNITNNKVSKPNTHVIYFKGKFPCNADGSKIGQIEHGNKTVNLTSHIVANYSFSNKPLNGYIDNYEKFMQYIKIISAPAAHIDPKVTACTYKVIESPLSQSVLMYSDTNSTRAEIDAISQKITGLKIGIIGLGGTGSYILDLLAKTLVGEIHLIDGDTFLQHNAFRMPGAPSFEQLKNTVSKVDYLYSIYSKMHKNIIPHNFYINESNVGMLTNLDTVFICIDKGQIKKLIFEKLVSSSITFIDTGIGIEKVDHSLLGMVRTTTSTKSRSEHLFKGLVSFEDNEDELYSSNIQIAPLNSLNAVFAVLKFYKLYGVLHDHENEHNCIYSTNGNQLISDEIQI